VIDFIRKAVRPPALFRFAAAIVFCSLWAPANLAAQDAANQPTEQSSKKALGQYLKGSIRHNGKPFLMAHGDSYGFLLAWDAVMKDADIAYERAEIPHRRRRRMFETGELLIDCCSAREWRQNPGEIAVQIFTEPVYLEISRYIFKSDGVLPIMSLADLRNLRIAAIEGFSYVNEQYFGEIIYVKDFDATFRLVESGRALATITSDSNFRQHMARHPRALAQGSIHSSLPISARVHKSRADIVPILNASITKLTKQGVLQKYIETLPE
jgi:hypothetical protein